jgi:hypothetical protein
MRGAREQAHLRGHGRAGADMHPDLRTILDVARAQIARGETPDAAALEARIRAVVAPGGGDALRALERLLAVARARRAVAAPPTPKSPPAPKRRAEVYRAKPTIAANMVVRVRANGGGVVLEWDAVRGVGEWDVRVADRPDARSPYTDRETRRLSEPRVELQLDDLPQRVSITGRTATGRIVQRAVVSGLTAENWRQKWQQRASAS